MTKLLVDGTEVDVPADHTVLQARTRGGPAGSGLDPARQPRDGEADGPVQREREFQGRAEGRGVTALKNPR